MSRILWRRSDSIRYIFILIQENMLSSIPSEMCSVSLMKLKSFSISLTLASKLLSVSHYLFLASSTIGNYNPLPDWGFNYFIYGERKGDSNVIFDLTIRSDNSWQSIQLGYLFSGRTDMSIGNFEAVIN